MSEISLTWEWKSTSPLHVGSGLSRLGGADRLVQRDPSGKAVIYGEAVKGAIRMGAEQVLAWLGESQHEYYAAQGTAEPRSWPLARLFGGEAMARCTPATLVTTDATSCPKGSRVFASTAINRNTGTADEQTLRKTEIVPPGLRFRACYTVSVARSEVEVVETLLVAALAAVESIGANAGIGWGRVALGSVCVKVDHDEHEPACVVSPERLEHLGCMIKETVQSRCGHQPDDNSGEVREAAGASSSDKEQQQWFKLTITLEEPTCLPDAPEISNKVTTNDWIAATTLRGALAAHWRRSGRSADVAAWLSKDTAWTPAFRVVDAADAALAVPAPRSFITTKRPLGDKQPVHDTLTGPSPSALQWKSIAGDAIVASDCIALAADPRLETRMHVARDYRTGSKRAGALYAHESLPPGTRFNAWARVPKGAFAEKKDKELKVLIGKRVSAGNGRATVKVEDADGPKFWAPTAGQDETESACDVAVHLVSPALVYDSETGYPLRTLDSAWWGKEFKEPLCPASDQNEEIPIRTAPGRRGGWMTNWRHARAAVTTIDAGSVWWLRCASPEAATSLRKRLRKTPYVGERSHEGFGWIAIDPPWLRRDGSKPLRSESPAIPPKAKGECTRWPGTSHDARTLACIARRMANEKVSDGCRRALQELAARVRAAGDGDAIVRLREFATSKQDKEKKRQKPSVWVSVMKILPKSDPLWKDREQLLFALEILIDRAQQEQGSR